MSEIYQTTKGGKMRVLRPGSPGYEKARSKLASSNGSALNCGMPNTVAYRLGLIAREVGTLDASKAGDEIDRGLILVRRLNEAGYDVVRRQT